MSELNKFVFLQFNSLAVNIEEGNLSGSGDEEKLKVIGNYLFWVLRIETKQKKYVKKIIVHDWLLKKQDWPIKFYKVRFFKVVETAIISVSDLLRDSEHAKDLEDIKCRYSVLGQEVVEEDEAERKRKEKEAEKKLSQPENVLRHKLPRHPEREGQEHCHVVTRPIFRRIISDGGDVSSGILVVNVPFIADSFEEE